MARLIISYGLLAWLACLFHMARLMVSYGAVSAAVGRLSGMLAHLPAAPTEAAPSRMPSQLIVACVDTPLPACHNSSYMWCRLIMHVVSAHMARLIFFIELA